MSVPRSVVSAQLLENQVQVVDNLQLRLIRQVAPRKWRRGLDSMAAAISEGATLEEAIDRAAKVFPREPADLFQASLCAPEPLRVILEALRTREGVYANWRLFQSLLVYPVVLLGVTLLVILGFSTVMRVAGTHQTIEEFGLSDLEWVQASARDLHHSILGVGIAYFWTLLTLLTVRLVGPRWALSAVVGGMLFIGSPLRWIQLQELLLRYTLFVSQGVQGVRAAQVVAATFAHTPQSQIASSIADRVARGVPLGRALSECALSDSYCHAAVGLIDVRRAEMGDNLREAAELVGALAEKRCRTLSQLLPVFLLLIVGSLVVAAAWLYVLSLLPLLQLIRFL